MLNRRILRIKAFKEIFAIEMLPDKSLEKARHELDVALEATRDLYLFMLASIPALTEVARERQEQLSRKVNKTEEEKNPNPKFLNNSLAEFFRTDSAFNRIYSKKKLSWDPYGLILHKVWASVQTKEWFQSYMASPETSLAADCTLFCHIFEEEFTERDDFAVALEDISIYWNDDLPYSLTWCCQTLKDLAAGHNWTMPPLYLSSIRSGMEDDDRFVHTLLREAFCNYDRYVEMIASVVPNWDNDRLVGTDIALTVTALAEMEHFPDIAKNISINEYVEISKYFGTPKSSVFVNGILDALAKKL